MGGFYTWFLTKFLNSLKIFLRKLICIPEVRWTFYGRAHRGAPYMEFSKMTLLKNGQFFNFFFRKFKIKFFYVIQIFLKFIFESSRVVHVSEKNFAWFAYKRHKVWNLKKKIFRNFLGKKIRKFDEILAIFQNFEFFFF